MYEIPGGYACINEGVQTQKCSSVVWVTKSGDTGVYVAEEGDVCWGFGLYGLVTLVLTTIDSVLLLSGGNHLSLKNLKCQLTNGSGTVTRQSEHTPTFSTVTNPIVVA